MQKNHKPDFAVWTSSSHILSFSCLGHNESHHTNKKVTEAEMIGQESGIRLT